MLITSSAAEETALLSTANFMMAAARTAPKGCGRDLITTLCLTGEKKEHLAEEMQKLGKDLSLAAFCRDAEGVREAGAIVLLGTQAKPLGLKICGFCGFKNCQKSREAGAICAFVSGDLGIAIGSAVSIAMEHRIDNRIMYTAGYTALRLELFSAETVIAYGIPLSVSSKNLFYDRN